MKLENQSTGSCFTSSFSISCARTIFFFLVSFFDENLGYYLRQFYTTTNLLSNKRKTVFFSELYEISRGKSRGLGLQCRWKMILLQKSWLFFILKSGFSKVTRENPPPLNLEWGRRIVYWISRTEESVVARLVESLRSEPKMSVSNARVLQSSFQSLLWKIHSIILWIIIL